MNLVKRSIKWLYIRYVHPEIMASMADAMKSGEYEWPEEEELTEEEKLVEAIIQRRLTDGVH